MKKYLTGLLNFRDELMEFENGPFLRPEVTSAREGLRERVRNQISEQVRERSLHLPEVTSAREGRRDGNDS